MEEHYLIIDVETCPIDLENYEGLDEEQRIKLINPIDSKIIAIGIRHNSINDIFIGENERDILESFWKECSSIRSKHISTAIVGFNILSFDIPFLTARSFINRVTISPFSLKSILDLKEKINAYRWGKTRGKLKEYASLMGLQTQDTTGNEIAKLCREKEFEKIKQYLVHDLEITDELYKRAIETKIIHISKW